MKNKATRGQAAVELAILGSVILLAFSTLIMYGQRFELQQQVKMEAFRKALRLSYGRNAGVTYSVKRDVRFASLLSGYGQGQHSMIGASANVMWQKGQSGLHDDAHGGTQSDTDGSFVFYQVNDDIIGDPEKGLPRYAKQSYSYNGSHREVMAPVGIWKEERGVEEGYNTEIKKEETARGGAIATEGSSITNSRSSDLAQKINGKYYARFDYSVDDQPQDDVTPLPDYETPQNTPPRDQVYEKTYEAYQRDDINRVGYRKIEPGNEPVNIHKERSWETAN